MKIVRQFDVFEKASDYIFEDIPIHNLDLKTIKGFLDNTKNDPLLYNGYKIEGKSNYILKNSAMNSQLTNMIISCVATKIITKRSLNKRY